MPRKSKSKPPGTPSDRPTKPSNLTAMMYHSILQTFDSMDYAGRSDLVDLMGEYSSLDPESCRSLIRIIKLLSSVPVPDRPGLFDVIERYVVSFR